MSEAIVDETNAAHERDVVRSRSSGERGLANGVLVAFSVEEVAFLDCCHALRFGASRLDAHADSDSLLQNVAAPEHEIVL